jgi:hypothetical protein
LRAAFSNHSREANQPGEKDSTIFAGRAGLRQEFEVRIESLNHHNMISLPAPDRRGEARAKRANQESKKCPQQ